MSELPELPPLETVLVLTGIVTARYLITSGLPYLALNVLGRKRFETRKLMPDDRTAQIPGQEIAWSLSTSAIFGLAGAALVFAWRAGITRIYIDPFQSGLAMLPLSFVLAALAHETYFYWTHRWMHLPSVFHRVHSVHHRSRKPTAFASFSFHPLEAALQAAFVPLLALILPMHWSVLFALLLFMTVLGVINHLGYEIYPNGFAAHPFFRWWISPTHHQLHHQRVACNFGLYFNVWDRWLGTHSADYTEAYRTRGRERARVATTSPDVAIVGAGLAGGLLALRLRQLRPELRLVLYEAGPRPGGNHTWSFHESDVSPADLAWLRPLIVKSWPRYEVRFPGLERRVELAYHSISSESFAAAVEAVLGPALITGAHVKMDEIDADCVLDARGWSEGSSAEGYQKFLGLELELEEPHGLTVPLLMDAEVPQLDGFRFFYVLPWSERRLLVEDTRYSSSSRLDEAALEAEIRGYAQKRGWKIARVTRQEKGILPIPLSRNSPRPPWPAIGARSGLFHDTTGYSLPDTVRLVSRLTGLSDLIASSVRAEIESYAASRARYRRFLRTLNRMLFRAAAPAERFRVLRHFYALPDPLIARFYAGEPSVGDALKILSGKPPVPVTSAIRAILGSGEARQ